MRISLDVGAMMKSTDSAYYQNVPRPIGAMSKAYPSAAVVPMHRHVRGQLIYAVSGVMEVTASDSLWLVPPQRAVWMPPGVEHRMRARGDVSLRTLYIHPDVFPEDFCSFPRTVQVSGLLRELILCAADIPVDYDVDGRDGRLMALLLEEIQWSPEQPLRLPSPRDQRLTRICEAILANPGDDHGLEGWGKIVGASSRTLARLFQAELGVSFRCWRQQVRILAALPRLAAGEPVTAIAADLGYETPGAFASMFRRLTGAKPSQYFPH
ncbi:AraC family transcriptional regulator [Rhodospirillum rubrum]|uniref:AraC family transcriptional regulator n=1 Tax=Rhodospirillum rubrum TaxID=1085 RepID=UPI00190820A9|nr:helix-turn-helix transcriptional regulator [Rhodospirillum rubrum]